MESIAIRQKKASMTAGLKRAVCNHLYKKYFCYRNDASEQEYKRYKNNFISIFRGTEKITTTASSKRKLETWKIGGDL